MWQTIKKYILRSFTFIGGFMVIMATLGWISALSRDHGMTLKDNIVLQVDLDQPFGDSGSSNPISVALHGYQPSLPELLGALELAAQDSRVKTVLVRLGDWQMPPATAQELRAAFVSLSAAGKTTFAFAHSFGELSAANSSYYLATGFNQIWLQPAGMVGLTGIAAEMPFFRALLDRFGITPQIMQRAEFKTAFENFTHKNITPANKQMLERMVGGLNQQLITAIAEGRKLPPATVQSLLAKGPFTATEAKEAKLIDRIQYADVAIKTAKKQAGKDSQQVHWQDYLYARHDELPAPKDDKIIALITASGAIMNGESDYSQLGNTTIGADTMTDAFTAAMDEKAVKAIVLRINSPGGTPVASETIRRLVVRAQKKHKPVVVSMGDVAASGGYWIAMNADRILALPATLTGSIGVVGGKMVVEDAAKEWQIGTAFIDGGIGNAGIWSPLSRYTPAQEVRINALMDQLYNQFTNRVSKARKIPPEKMADIAKGRVWLGSEAKALGLVDELGGLPEAFKAARTLAKIPDGERVAIVPYPPERSLRDEVLEVAQHFLNSQISFGQFTKALAALAPLALMMQPPAALQMPPIAVK